MKIADKCEKEADITLSDIEKMNMYDINFISVGKHGVSLLKLKESSSGLLIHCRIY